MITEILVTTAFFIVFGLILYRWNWIRTTGIRSWWFVVLFAVKAAAGISGGYLYLHYYDGGDTWTFFRDSRVLTEAFKADPSACIGFISGLDNSTAFMEKYGVVTSWHNNDIVYNDNRTIIVVNAVIGLISYGVYPVHVLVFAFLSTLGLIGLFKAFRLVADPNPVLLFAAVFLAPGVLFWLSMELKESLLIFVLGLLIYHCFMLITISRSAVNMAGMFLSGFMFIHIKAYVMILVTPCLLAFIWVHATGNRLSLLKYLAVYLVSVLLFFNADKFLPGVDLVDVLIMKRHNFEAVAHSVLGQANSYINIPEITSNWGDILTATPIAAFMVLARPYIWESKDLLVILAAIENILLCSAILLGFRFIRWDKLLAHKNLVLFSLFFVFTSFVLIGLTTPVMGSMVRYKAPVLPFLLLFPVLISGKKLPPEPGKLPV